MKPFIQAGIAAVESITVVFNNEGVVIQPLSGGFNNSKRIYITDVSMFNDGFLSCANTLSSGKVLAYIAKGNINYSAPIRVPDLSGVFAATSVGVGSTSIPITGSITYFLE